MKNYMIAGIFLLFLAAAGLLLPSSVMKWQDEQRTGKSETEEVQEVVLKEQISMTLTERLKLQVQENVNALTLVNGRNYSQDTIEEQVRKEVGLLTEQGILIDFDPEPMEVADVYLLFHVDMEDSERSVMMWEGYVRTLKYELSFNLDDETGKIVSFIQYESDNEAIFDHAQMQGVDEQSGTQIVAAYKFPLSMEADELEELAKRWGEYLGCRVTEFRSSRIGFNIELEREEIYRQIEAMVSKGYSQEEAERMLAMEWGIDLSEEGTGCGDAVLEDAGGQVSYVFRPMGSVFRVEPVFR